MRVAGIGCRKGASAEAIAAAIEAALIAAGIETCDAIAAPQAKRDEAGLSLAAARYDVPLFLLDAESLAAVAGLTLTRSDRALALYGVPSVAETAALAGAGSGARLLAPRVAVGPATCAVAVGGESP